jgi:hypothetical protein
VPDEAKVNEAMGALGEAMSMLAPSEKQHLAAIRKQVDDAGEQGATYDKRLEFCYALLFTPEIKNERLRSAAKAYVDAAEAK